MINNDEKQKKIMYRENCSKLNHGPRTQVCHTGSDVSLWPAVAGVSHNQTGRPKMSEPSLPPSITKIMKLVSDILLTLEKRIDNLEKIVVSLEKKKATNE